MAAASGDAPARPGLRVGLIGCGRIAWAHVYGWTAVPGASICALSDINRDATAELGMRCGVGADHQYTDYREMLRTERPDVVIVSLWHALHAEAVIAATTCGPRLVLCEKPMAPSLGEAEQMVVAAQRSGAKLAIAHQRRFYPGWELARDAIASGAIGRPTHAWAGVRDGVLNSGTHSVDLVRYVTGDPSATTVTAAVQRHTDRYERGTRCEDSALGMVEFDSGFRLFFESDIDPHSYISARTVVSGTDGMVSIDENHVRLLSGSSGGWLNLSGAPFGSGTSAPTADPEPDSLRAVVVSMVAHFGPANASAFADTFVAQARALADWVDGRLDDHRGDARHGYATIEILMALYESARTREVVRLPLETRTNPLDLMVEAGALPVTRPGRYDIRAALVRGEGMGW